MKYTVYTASTHIERCNANARVSEEAIFRAIFLAVGSIRINSKQFWTNILPTAYTSYIRFNRDLEKASKQHKNFCAMKNKRRAIEFAERHKYSIARACRILSEHDFYLWLVKTVPGLGAAKAAFVSQMVNGHLGCIDTANHKRFEAAGIEIKRTQSPIQYAKIFEATGETSAEMWHAWCVWIAERDGFNACKLSEAHALFIEQGTFHPEFVIS